MKKILIYILGLNLFLASCDYLDVVPENIASYEDVFKGKTEAEKALQGLYSYIPQYSTFRGNLDCVTDEFALPPGWGNVWFPPKNMWESAFNASSLGYNYWSNTDNAGFNSYHNYNMYEGIRYCHMFLNRVDGVPDISDKEKKQWVAEAKFLIGYYHYMLFKIYGPLVLVDSELSFNASGDDFYPMRATVDETVDFIVGYLSEAVRDLDNSYDARYAGKPTSVAVKTLIAKLYVTVASPFYNGNPDAMYRDLANPDGTKLFPSSFDANRWNTALNACKEAIDAAHAAGHALYHYSGNMPTAWETWTEQDQHEATNRYKIVDKFNEELIWGYSNINPNHGWYWQYQGLRTSRTPTRPLNAVQVTIEAVERFYTKNGLPIDVDPSYDYANRYSVKEGDSTAYLNRDRDPRFYATVGFDRGRYEVNNKTFVIHHRAGEEQGLLSGVNDCGPTGYVIKKFIHPETYVDNTTKSYVTYPHPILRLADLYLLYVEAYNEVNGRIDGAALDYLNQIRDRAGIPSLGESWSKVGGVPASKEALREIIKAERYNEFSIENQFFYDIRRWLDAEKYLDRPVHGWDITKSTEEGFYQIQSTYENLKRSFSQYFYLLPIPQTEINVNYNLVQNPGWR